MLKLPRDMSLLVKNIPVSSLRRHGSDQIQICSIDKVGGLSQTEPHSKENRKGCERSLTNHKAVWEKGD